VLITNQISLLQCSVNHNSPALIEIINVLECLTLNKGANIKRKSVELAWGCCFFGYFVWCEYWC